MPVKIDIQATAEAAARRAAEIIAVEAAAAVQDRGRFLIATSGGSTPLRMLEVLSELALPWPLIHWFQVDERVTELTSPERNFRQLRESLLGRVGIPADQIYAMPVDDPDLEAAALSYAAQLEAIAGVPPVLDLIHLGVGTDGHMASLVPGDEALTVDDRSTALTGIYSGCRRMTITLPVISNARRILWLVTGPEKREPLSRAVSGDHSIPAGRVPTEHAVFVVDAAAVARSAVSPR